MSAAKIKSGLKLIERIVRKKNDRFSKNVHIDPFLIALINTNIYLLENNDK